MKKSGIKYRTSSKKCEHGKFQAAVNPYLFTSDFHPFWFSQADFACVRE